MNKREAQLSLEEMCTDDFEQTVKEFIVDKLSEKSIITVKTVVMNPALLSTLYKWYAKKSSPSKSNLNYPNYNNKFVETNYKWMEVLCELSMLFGLMGYYPDMDSREQRSAIINHARLFCISHNFTDWSKEDFLSSINDYANQIYVKWAKEQVLIKNSPYDLDVIVKVREWVKKIEKNGI
jgi:hypothetical protein